MNIEQYKKAKLIREFEQLLLQLFGLGKLNGTVHTCVGQEIIPVVLSDFITDEDTFFSNHRGHGHYLTRTGDVKGLLAEIMGKVTGCSGGYGGSQHLYVEKKFYSNGIQGGMTPVATGYAFSKKISGKPGISVVFIGDGTLGEGTLYEAMNCAAIKEAPILFVLEHNGYAQSTSSKQTFAGSSQKRFEGFGMNYFKGDIWDLKKLEIEFKKAVSTARDFKPSVIEVSCYRLNSHSKGDDNRSDAEVKEFLAKDPLNVFETNFPAETSEAKKEIEKLLQETLELVEKEQTLEHAIAHEKIFNAKTKFNLLEQPANANRINELIYQAFRDELNKNDQVVFLGEDIENSNEFNPKPYGGAFKVTKDISNLSEKVYNMPISEAAITGIGTGLALESKLAVSEIMFGDFTTLTLDQLLQHASKFQGMYGRKLHIPFILRTPMGGKRGYGPTHSQSLEKHFLGIYGINVLALNYRINPAQFYSDLFSAIKSPTIVVENKIDYTRYFNTPYIKTHEYFISDNQFPVLKLTPKGMKPQCTVFCYGGMLADVESAVEELFIEHEIAVEVICPLSLYPVNISPLIDSVSVTKKIVTVEEGGSFAGLGSEIIAQLISCGVMVNKAKQTGNNAVIPSSFKAEINLLPSKQSIIETLLKL